MKKILMLFFLLAISVVVTAQKNYEDVVFLKNGGKIRGIIFEQIPFKNLSICTPNGDTLIFRTDEIESLTREPVLKGRKSNRNNFRLKTGYQGMVEMGGSVPFYEGISCFKISIINSYRFNPYFSTGFGTGLRHNSLVGNAYTYANLISNEFSFPAYLDTRINFSVHRLSPFLTACLGYSFDIGNNHPPQIGASYITVSGLLFSSSAGVSYIVSDRFSINFGIGYEKQQFILFEKIGYRDRTTFSNGFSINFGLSF